MVAFRIDHLRHNITGSMRGSNQANLLLGRLKLEIKIMPELSQTDRKQFIF